MSALRNPREGQTPLNELLRAERVLTAEDYTFGNQAALAAAHTVPLREKALSELAKLSIQSQEELLGYLSNPSLSVETFAQTLDLPVQTLPRLKRFLEQNLDVGIVSSFETLSREEYAFGAAPPPAERGQTTPTEEPLGEGTVIIAPCLPTIKDQGRRGTCVAHAACAVVEFEYCVQQGVALDLSEQFHFWHCKQYDQLPNRDATRPNVAFTLLRAYGICDEAEWAYNPHPIPGNVPHDPPGPSPRIDPRAPNQPVAPFRTVTSVIELTPPNDAAKIRGYISAGHPVAVAIPAFASWVQNPNTRLTGEIPMPLPAETCQSGHAFVLIGWAKDPAFAGGGYFVVRNSWGTRWGAQCVYGAGHGVLPFDFIQRHNLAAHTVTV